VLSISQIRRHVRREVWWTIHLGMYWALALAFLHEVALGPSFVGHPVTVVVWSVAWAATAGVVLVYRLGMPIYRTLHHDLRVAEVRNEAPGVVSIICQGKDLEGLQVAGGQFFEWRFWTGGLWWHSHPYSMSAKPQPPYIRLTVKASGDHSAALHHLRPGTRVGIEGPYGAFTAAARRHKKVVLIAGGIGITSVRSLLEDLPRRSEPVVVWRATTDADMALRTEVEELVHRLQGRLFYVVGSRAEVPLAAVLDQVRQLRGRDVYVAGSPSFVEGIGAIAMARGVPAESLHYEEYAL
jgi:ferredoxin-NADP reductase